MTTATERTDLAVSRLAAALTTSLREYPFIQVTSGVWLPPERVAQDILAADPELATALEHGLAWLRAEKALPEGWWLAALTSLTPTAWAAQALGPMPEAMTKTGPTPTAALLALADALEGVGK